MKIRFLTVADQEYRDAYDYYEAAVDNLGDDFKVEVISTIARI
jgi:hypothetical protein